MIRSTFVAAALSALVSAIATPALADELNFAALSVERPNVATARTGMEAGLVAELGYRRVVRMAGRNAAFGIDVGAPLAALDVNDYRARMVLALPLLDGEHWKLVGALGPTVRGVETALNHVHAFGVDTRITAGYYALSWFAAVELGIEAIGGAYIENSDRYREVVYAAAKDGWYRDTGGTFYAGAHAGVSLRAFDIVLRLGHARASTFESKTVPFFALLGANVHLP